MGTSDDEMERATTSAHIMNIAPNRTDTGNSFQWFVPTSARDMCGMMRPTKPMIPQLHTIMPMMTDVMMTYSLRMLFRFTPSVVAVESPSIMALRLRI